MKKILPLFLFLAIPHLAFARPSSYTELLDYVQEAPDQAEVNTCLFMASTGAVELLANKFHGIKNPKPMGKFDLAESFTMFANGPEDKTFFENPSLRYSNGVAVHHKDWPFEAWDNNSINNDVWSKHPNFAKLPRIKVPGVETVKLFMYGNKWSTYVLDESHIEMIKEALVKYRSPILVNYNDQGFWHVILIVGYDDNLTGQCYDTEPSECNADIGSFYIRDSFGIRMEIRDYDWFRAKGNAAFVVKLK